MSRRIGSTLALLGGLTILGGCGEEVSPYELYGRVYDVRVIPDVGAAKAFPAGSATVTSSGTNINRVVVALTGLPAGSYTAVVRDASGGQIGNSVEFTPTAGKGTVTFDQNVGAAAQVQITPASSGSDVPIWISLRGANNAPIAKPAAVFGHFGAQPEPFRYTVRGSGRVGIQEIGNFGSNDFRLTGLLDNVSVPPPGFTYVVWLFDSVTSTWQPIGSLLDQNGKPLEGIDQLPSADQRRELPRVFVDWKPQGVDMRNFTHFRVSLEQQGAVPDVASNVIYTGVFGRQFTNRRPQET